MMLKDNDVAPADREGYAADQRYTRALERIAIFQACAMVPLVWTVVTFARIGLVGNDDKRKAYYLAAAALSLFALNNIWDAGVNMLRGMRHPLGVLRSWGLRQSVCLAIAVTVALASWAAPRVMVNHIGRSRVLIGGHLRYQEGRWGDALAIYDLARPLDENAVAIVREMQTLLMQAGYYNQPINGIPDRHIMDALRQLQRDYGFEPDGIADFKTRTVLLGLVYRKPLNLTGPAAPTYSMISDAVMEFQRKHGLYADGTIDLETLRAIKKAASGPVHQETDRQSFIFSFQDLGSLASTTTEPHDSHLVIALLPHGRDGSPSRPPAHQYSLWK